MAGWLSWPAARARACALEITLAEQADTPTGLAQQLREGTWPLHSASERAGIMPALLRGALPLHGFLQLQRNLLPVYQALETGLAQHAAHPGLAPLLHPALARSAALQADLADLAALCSPHQPAEASAMVPAAVAYADRLVRLAAQQPGALAAHAYVRYLGDLAGGQALRRVVQQAYGLADATGTRFFGFGPPAQVLALRLAFRHGLDALPLDAAGAAALVAEAQWSFGQHVRLFEELAATTR